jgi:Mn-dependent DtxR family transcriptional regulator
MKDIHLAHLVLQHLFTLAEDTRPASIGQISTDLGLNRQVVSHVLRQLDRAGLADCARIRLTLSGLAVAVATRRSSTLAAAA